MTFFRETLIDPIFDVESIGDGPRVLRAHLEVVLTQVPASPVRALYRSCTGVVTNVHIVKRRTTPTFSSTRWRRVALIRAVTARPARIASFNSGVNRLRRCRAVASNVRGRTPERVRPSRPSDAKGRGVQLRHERLRQLCLCRHAAVDPRHSHASELRACFLGRRSAHSGRLGSCCAPVAQGRGCAAAVPVLLQRREHACHGCGSRLWASCTHPNACGTLYRLCTRLRRLVCVVPLIRSAPPLYTPVDDRFC